jgi:hypothetical protein
MKLGLEVVEEDFESHRRDFWKVRLTDDLAIFRQQWPGRVLARKKERISGFLVG